jgi:hypothetical protein
MTVKCPVEHQIDCHLPECSETYCWEREEMGLWKDKPQPTPTEMKEKFGDAYTPPNPSPTPQHEPSNPERIARYQTNYRSILSGHGYEPTPERADFLKLMEGREYGESPLLSAWAWFREGRASHTPSEKRLTTEEAAKIAEGCSWSVGDAMTVHIHNRAVAEVAAAFRILGADHEELTIR